FFMTAKHDPALSTVNPFADDPYDAIGSFGIQVAVLLGILAGIRLMRSSPNAEQIILLLRTQLGAILAVSVTPAGDLVGMIRFPGLWLGKRAGTELLGLFSTLALWTLIIAWLVLRSARPRVAAVASGPWQRALQISLLAIAIAYFYPLNL